MTGLTSIVEAEAGRKTFPRAADAFCEELKRKYGPSAVAVLFYGSCLRQKTDIGLMLDFYVLVDNYVPALDSRTSAVFAHLLPPNVYYLEMPCEDRIVRAKVAVISVKQFLHGTSPKCFTSSLWARFAQPSAILYARDDEVRRRVIGAFANAVSTMIERAIPLMSETFSERDLWVRALSETYGAELRPERETKSAEFVDADLLRYTAVTDAVLGAHEADGVFHQPHDTATMRPGSMGMVATAYSRQNAKCTAPDQGRLHVQGWSGLCGLENRTPLECSNHVDGRRTAAPAGDRIQIIF